MPGQIRIRLHGGFRVLDAQGGNITPKGQKACGLLALLATGADFERTRTWLQDKLWSDRGAEQGSASLRQALSQIRRELGDHKDILIADRHRVALDPARVVLLTGDGMGEFLEGIEVRDEEFEDWLRQERNSAPRATGGAAATGRRESFFLRPVSPPGTELHLCETLSSSSVHLGGAPDGSASGVLVDVAAFHPANGRLAVRISASHSSDMRGLWSGVKDVVARGAVPYDDIGFLSLGNQLVAALAECFEMPDAAQGLPGDGAAALGQAGVRKLFEMHPDAVRDADRLFAQAFERDRRGLYLAWRAQLRGIQFVELHGFDRRELVEEGLAFARQALELEPSNSMVLATVANARLILDRDLIGCDELSRRGTTLNPANPMAWWARAAAETYGGKLKEAFCSSRKARQLAGPSPFRFWWDLQCALTSAVLGRIDEAIEEAERCAATNPGFRPPLRYLTGLYALKHHEAGAARSAQRLRAVEDGFSPDRMANDPDYPVGLMRQYNLLDRRGVAAIGR